MRCLPARLSTTRPASFSTFRCCETAGRLTGNSRASSPTALGCSIFERLIEHPSAVGELARELPVSRPAVSQHLKVLKDAGLVVDKRAGKQRIYQVDPDGLAALRDEPDRFWSKTLAAYKTVVEQPTQGDPMSIQAADTSVQTSIVV